MILCYGIEREEEEGGQGSFSSHITIQRKLQNLSSLADINAILLYCKGRGTK